MRARSRRPPCRARWSFPAISACSNGAASRSIPSSDRDRQSDRHSLRLAPDPARPRQSRRAEPGASARHAKSACSRCTARPMASMLASVPLAPRHPLHAAALGLHRRHRPEDQQDRLAASQRHHPRQCAAPAARSSSACRCLGGPITTAGGVAFLTGYRWIYIRAYDVTDRPAALAGPPAGGRPVDADDL